MFGRSLSLRKPRGLIDTDQNYFLAVHRGSGPQSTGADCAHLSILFGTAGPTLQGKGLAAWCAHGSRNPRAGLRAGAGAGRGGHTAGPGAHSRNSVPLLLAVVDKGPVRELAPVGDLGLDAAAGDA